MKKLSWNIIGIVVLTFSILYYGCKKTDEQGWTDEEKKSYEEVINLQNEVSNSLDDWFLSMDSLDAIIMAKQSFIDNLSVSEATINNKGIAVQYTNGIRGGIFLKGKRFDYKKSTVSEPLAGSTNAVNDLKSIVNDRKMIQMDAAYSEFSYYTNQVHDINSSNLSRVGISIDEYLKDSEVTLDRLTQLAGYGIVDMSGHGIPWPKENNITDIYYLTGEIISENTTKKYWDEIKTGNIPIVKIMRFSSGTKYCISHDFISSHNDFSNDTIFFYGGFCYSFLGGWPDIIDDFGDGAYLGFDWSVQGYNCANWDINSLALMSDTSKTKPLNLEEWFNDGSVEKSYNEEGRTISIHYTGDGNLTLWGDVSINLIALSDDGTPVSNPGEAGVDYPFKCEVVSNISELEYVWDIGDGSSPVTASNAVYIKWSEDGEYVLKVDVKDKSNGNIIGSATADVTIGAINEVKEFVLSCDHIWISLGPAYSVQFSPEWFLNESDALNWDASSLEWSGLNFSAIGTSSTDYNYTITGSLSNDGEKISFTAINEKVTSPGIHEEKYTISVSDYPLSHYEHGTPFPDWAQYSVSSDYQNYVSEFEGYYISNGVTYTITGYNWNAVNEFKVLFSKNN